MKFVLTLLFVALVGIGYGQTTNVVDTYVGESESSPAADPHFAEKIQSAGREQQERFRPRISIEDAVGDDVPLAAPRQAAQPLPAQSPNVWLNDSRTLLLAFVAVVLTGAFLSRRLLLDFLKALNAGFNPLMATADSAATRLPANVRAEEKGLAEFLAALKAGPSAIDADPAGSVGRPSIIRAFYEKMPAKLGNLRQMARELRRTSDDSARRKILAALRWELHAIRAEAGVPELLAFWQLAFAMEGLLKQLTENAANVTPSTLRTLKGSLELLGDINRPGIESALLNRKPLQLLAVDDDPIGRRAVSCALERALNKPGLAEDCEAALALAAAKTYDVIFLDVQMPKMDGFELCSKIHETAANRNTPIVFVTGHSDFETRAKSTVIGNADLIAKPFLTFEITVKALTAVLRARLSALSEIPVAVENPLPPASEAVDDVQSSQLLLETTTSSEENIEAWKIANLFLADASVRLRPLREAFQDLWNATDSDARRDLLGDIFVYIHAFTPRDLADGHPAAQLRGALEGMLRKLLEDPSVASDSTFLTLASGIQVLDELWQSGAVTAPLSDQPLRILVVDDDPASCRTIGTALQMVVGKPDEAESGDAALVLAGHQSYDVIFMDAQMPIIDGFETYDRIRQATANESTPVIFVAGRGDAKSRARAAAAGAGDFIEKPFLNPEIALKALAFALRGRLKRIQENEGSVAVSTAPSSTPWSAEVSV